MSWAKEGGEGKWKWGRKVGSELGKDGGEGKWKWGRRERWRRIVR